MARVRDFSHPHELMGREGAEFFGRVLALISDLAFVVDSASGQVLDIACGFPGFDRVVAHQVEGRSIYELVTKESQPKVRDLLVNRTPGKWRQVNFAVEGGADLPVSMRSIELSDDRMLLAGREDSRLADAQRSFAAAQRELELTFARLRRADTRYRSLLNLLDIAVCTLDGPLNRIEEISDSAAGIVDGDARKLHGRQILDYFAEEDRDRLASLFERTRAGYRSAALAVRMRDGSEQTIRAAPYQAGSGRQILLHFAEGSGAVEEAGSFEFLSGLPYGVVTTDREFIVTQANAPFAHIVAAPSPEALIGRPLDDLLGSRGLDIAIMGAELRDHGAFHNFASLVPVDGHDPIEVDVDGARVMSGGEPVFTFLIRPRLIRSTAGKKPVNEDALAVDIQESVGRMPLKAIVRQTTDIIERAAIGRALELTANNRAAAAEMLGVSRQNLYDKIDRHGIGSDNGETSDDG
ncbi:hypothetical protein MKP08_13855 [Erythrobacter sp. LQ02-29]|uniref:helix-turn-helix domain-containing protein n=1 Tax=Erythrobacter sp. LQ02-29 TaxID=2920384 RepID=UPI001F4D4401|nr:helix-turn-helix domain-containing protein [Erythrobacter sp. LQ02-29]MCP9223828.1 hypothetical protein [Erythrobacter sp. LQ02-29]